MTKNQMLALKIIDALGEAYGLDIAKSSLGALRRGTVYLVLGELERRGLVSSRPELDPLDASLPRRLYRLTPTGLSTIQEPKGARLEPWTPPES